MTNNGLNDLLNSLRVRKVKLAKKAYPSDNLLAQARFLLQNNEGNNIDAKKSEIIKDLSTTLKLYSLIKKKFIDINMGAEFFPQLSECEKNSILNEIRDFEEQIVKLESILEQNYNSISTLNGQDFFSIKTSCIVILNARTEEIKKIKNFLEDIYKIRVSII